MRITSSFSTVVWQVVCQRYLQAFFIVLCAASVTGCASLKPAQTQAIEVPKEGPQPEAQSVIDFESVKDPYFHLIVAELARQNRQWRQAQLSYKYALRELPLPDIARNGFHMSLVLGDAKTAEAFARQWQQLDMNPESTAAFATVLVRNGRVQPAVETFDQFVSGAPSGGGDPFELVAAILSRPELSEFAMPVMEGLVQIHPNNAMAALNLARLAYRQEDLNKAYLAANRALDLEPSLLDARLVRAQVLLNRGDVDAALMDLQEALVEQPYNVRILNTLANIYLNHGQEDKAKELLDRVLNVAPDDAAAILAMAKTAVKNRDYTSASGYFMRLYELNEEPSLAAYYLGAVAEENAELDKAIDWYRRVRGGPQLQRAQERIAAVMVRQGDLPLAREHLRSVRTALPTLAARFYLLEAEILQADERPDSALKLLEKAIAEFPQDADLRYSRSLLLVELGAYGLAEADLLVALETSPDDAKLLNALGYTLADNTNRYDEAYHYIARALDLAPESASIIDSMGWVLFRQGKVELAIDYLKRAYDKMREPEIAAHLGEALWAYGQEMDAESIWRSAWSLSGRAGREMLRETINRVAPKVVSDLLKVTE